jgi:superfamily II DNA/RNA helicase
MKQATGFRSEAKASHPIRSASRGIDPPPANGSTTAAYLESALREHHSRVAKLVGALSFLEREQALQEFAEDGGILIVTESMSSTIPEVTAAIFYDLPINPAVLDARIGQFVRVGRQGPIRIFAFTDGSNALVIERLQRKLAEIKNSLGEQERQALQEVLFSKDKKLLQELLSSGDKT